jgi:hypothetical protein
MMSGGPSLGSSPARKKQLHPIKQDQIEFGGKRGETVRESTQRQADGASKAEQRIQLAVCAVGGCWDRKTRWLSGVSCNC